MLGTHPGPAEARSIARARRGVEPKRAAGDRIPHRGRITQRFAVRVFGRWRTPALTSGDAGPILRSLTSWDGWYYLGIVRDGYQADPVSGAYSNVAFPPLYPLIVRLLSWPIPGSEGIVAILVSNVAFLAALFVTAWEIFGTAFRTALAEPGTEANSPR